MMNVAPFVRTGTLMDLPVRVPAQAGGEEEIMADNGNSGKRGVVTLPRVLVNIEQYLEHEKENGRMCVEVSPTVATELGKLPSVNVTRATTKELQLEPRQVAYQAGTAAAESDEDAERQSKLNDIARRVRACKACPLYETRKKTVPGQGHVRPEIMFVGEAPGFDEDRKGVAFIGAAGRLLTKMIQAMGLKREEVFIGNILKCRPPGNRTPMPDEMTACMPFLKAQIVVLKPRVIVALGGTAVKGLLGVTTGITKLRGTWMAFEGIDTMPTYHPAYLLRNTSAKRDAWNDLKEVLRHIGRKPPPTRKGTALKRH